MSGKKGRNVYIKTKAVDVPGGIEGYVRFNADLRPRHAQGICIPFTAANGVLTSFLDDESFFGGWVEGLKENYPCVLPADIKELIAEKEKPVWDSNYGKVAFQIPLAEMHLGNGQTTFVKLVMERVQTYMPTALRNLKQKVIDLENEMSMRAFNRSASILPLKFKEAMLVAGNYHQHSGQTTSVITER